jgi:1-acyl-sn-glycerol-3-phosphate acyltransferase
MLKYVLAGYFWLLFLSTTAVLFLWVSLVYAFHRVFRPRKISEACHNVAILWSRTLFALGPAWTAEVRGRENLPPSRMPYVMVANHTSSADIWAFFLIGGQFRWVSKDAMFKIPLVGKAMKWAGYVPVSRGHRRSQLQALAASRRWLQEGIPMAFFPEGTRSEDGEVKEFKSGAFKLAQEENVPIVPIALRGTRDMLVKNSGFPRKAHLDIEILPPVHALPGEDQKDFAERVRQMISSKLLSYT